MATFSNGPGVYVSESLSPSFTPTTPGGPVAAFFGEAARGPATSVLVRDWPTYKSIFGDLEDQYDLGYAVYGFFANGGRNAYVTRVYADDAVEATLALPYYPSGTGSASAAFFTVDAVSPGTWGNNLTVQTINGLVNNDPDAAADALDFSTFTLVVRDGTTEVERWTELSLDPNSSRYVATLVNTYSKYVEVSSVATADLTGDFTFAATNLASGSDGSAIDANDWSAAFDKIDNVTGDLIINAAGADAGSDAGVIQLLATKAVNRGTGFVISDPSKTLTDLASIQTEVTTLLGAVTSANRGYVAHYATCLKMVDPAKSGPGAIRTTYPGGALAGLYCRTQNERTTAASPAGWTADISGALGTAVVLSSADAGTLYEASTAPVNTFRAVPGAGVVAFGTRTLALTKPDKFIPVRRTLNYLKYELGKLTEYSVFEPNDANLWADLTSKIEGFLTNFYQRGGLKGNTLREAFYVVCDASNNTSTSMDQGVVNIEVGVSLQTPAEYIQINIAQWGGGTTTSESL